MTAAAYDAYSGAAWAAVRFLPLGRAIALGG